MRHRIVIQTIGRTPDGGGGFQRADTPGAEVWCRVDPAHPGEVAAYAQLQQRVTHRLTIRRNAAIKQGVTVTWRAPGGDVDLYVLGEAGTDPGGRPGEFQVLMCRQGGNL